VKLVQGLLFILLILLAAIIGTCIGAIFGLFVGPAQVISWVKNEGSTDTDTDNVNDTI